MAKFSVPTNSASIAAGTAPGAAPLFGTRQSRRAVLRGVSLAVPIAVVSSDRAARAALREPDRDLSPAQDLMAEIHPTRLPDFMLEGAHGLSPLESPPGKALLVNVWATWCPACIEELPGVFKAAMTWPQTRVTMVASGQSYAQLPAIFVKHAGEAGIRLLADPQERIGHGMPWLLTNGDLSLPTTLLVSKSGHILATVESAADWSLRHNPKIAALLDI